MIRVHVKSKVKTGRVTAEHELTAVIDYSDRSHRMEGVKFGIFAGGPKGEKWTE